MTGSASGVARRLGRVSAPLLAGALAVAAASPAAAYMKNRGAVQTFGPDGQAAFADSDINVIEDLGGQVPAELTFVDGQGRRVSLGSLLGRDKPVILTLGYYTCPMLCTLVHEGLAKAIKGSGLQLGKDFLGVAVSIDPKEDAKTANTNRRRLLRSLGHGEDADWPFLLAAEGEGKAVERLAEKVGFRYKYDEKSKQFAHAAVAIVLSPKGKITRYIHGVDVPPRDLRMALVEAGEGRVGTSLDRVLQTCFRYDPMTQRYTPFVMGFVRIGAGTCFLALATLLGVLWRRELLARRIRGLQDRRAT
jgi:protein SCO1